ncbi:MAG: alpha/beta hydrolase [Planctomycetaceae bacterium]|nr:alpha/beta hydrolase [Planctomycetaceae bacterium]
MSLLPILYSVLACWLLPLPPPACAQSDKSDLSPRIIRDLEYARTNDVSLQLDLYLPKGSRPAPVVVWVHGGAWRAGSKDSVPVKDLLQHGFAIASVDYRLSPVAKFPAQVHDIKAAIRYLRGTAEDHGIDSHHISIAGASAGGHLAALVGVTNGHAALEGRLGSFLESSSDVEKVVSFYGASNLESILGQSTPHGLRVREPALNLLLGEDGQERKRLANLASPVSHVDAHDPPLLLIHGDQDPQMPINQSHELHGKYKQRGLPVQFDVVHGGAHGGRAFFQEAQMRRVAIFLKPVEGK